MAPAKLSVSQRKQAMGLKLMSAAAQLLACQGMASLARCICAGASARKAIILADATSSQ